MNLKPFFTYLGGKYRTAHKYPAPRHDVIVEPFAGSAGYAVRNHERQVILVERDEKIAAVWRYLLTASPDEVAALPLVGEGWQTTDDLTHLPPGARYLIGLWLNKGTASPRKTPSAWCRSGIRPNSMWGMAIRERIAGQLDAIRHWRLIESDYSSAPDVEATWFVDPPYVGKGHQYRFGSSLIDYAALGAWTLARPGQVIACEGPGATWLPFEPLGAMKAQRGQSLELVYAR